MLLMFSNVKTTLKFSVYCSFLLTTINHKSCTLSHNFSRNRKLYFIRKRLTKFRFKTRFYTQTLWRVTESHQINKSSSFFFFNFNFQSICPHQIFLSVLATILTYKFVIKKNLPKIPVLSFSFDWNLMYTSSCQNKLNVNKKEK